VVGCVNGPSVDWPLSAQPSGTVWFQETTSFPHEDSQPPRPLWDRRRALLSRAVARERCRHHRRWSVAVASPRPWVRPVGCRNPASRARTARPCH